jgi:phospholipase C
MSTRLWFNKDSRDIRPGYCHVDTFLSCCLSDMIISPYAKEGYVDNTLYDVTSILKFIDYNFGLQPLSTGDANANNMLNAFDFGQPPREPLELNLSTVQSAISENKKIGEYKVS